MPAFNSLLKYFPAFPIAIYLFCYTFFLRNVNFLKSHSKKIKTDLINLPVIKSRFPIE